MKPSREKLKELVNRIVRVAHPRRIILFGSAARGTMGPDSDLDVLVIMRNGIHRRRTAGRIHLGLWGFGIAKDIVVVTEEDVEKYGGNPYMVICNALREGKELYRAA